MQKPPRRFGVSERKRKTHTLFEYPPGKPLEAKLLKKYLNQANHNDETADSRSANEANDAAAAAAVVLAARASSLKRIMHTEALSLSREIHWWHRSVCEDRL